MFNAFVPPANIAAFTRRSHQRAGKHWFGHIEAGAPPSDSSIVDAAGGYGRYGVQVVLSEILGVSHAPVKAEDVPLLMEELMERMQERLGNNRQI